MRRWWIVLSSTLSVALGTLGLATVVAPAASAMPPPTDTLVFTSMPTTVAQGAGFSVTVSAQNAGLTDSGYSGTVSLSSTTDGAFSAPASVAAVNGVATFNSVQFSSSAFGSQNLTASSLTANSGTTTINVYGPATHLVFSSAPTTAASGTSFNVGVTAEDSSGDTARSFTDTVSFSLTDADGNATLPAPYTFTSGDGGTHMFPVTLVKGDASQAVNVGDTTNGSVTSATASGIHVLPSAIALTAPSTATAGVDFTLSAQAKDSDNSDDSAYSGTAHVTSTDAQVSPESDLSFSGGTASLTTAVLKTAGSQTLTATDSVHSSVTGTSNAVAVGPAALSRVVAAGPASATAGHAFGTTFTAEDQFGNTETSDNGTISVSSTIGSVTPSTDDLASGVVAGNFTINKTGTGTISASQAGGGSPVASNPFTVAPDTATQLVISAVPTETAGTADTTGVTITVEDAHDNVVTGDNNGLTISDNAGPGTVTPITASLSNGSVTIHPTFSKTGTQHMSVSDTTDSIAATDSNDFSVTPGALASFDVVPTTTSPDEGVPFNVTVTAKDADGNVKTDYSGPFTFQATDALNGIFPSGNQSLANGVGTFTGILLYGSGDQNVDVKDVTSALTAQSAAIDVLPTTSTLTGPGTVHTSAQSSSQNLTFSLQTTDSAHHVVSIPTTAYSNSASSASVTVCGNVGLTCTLETNSISGSAPTFTVNVSVPTGCFAPQTITLRLEDPTSGDTAVSSTANPVSASGTLDIAPTCNLALSVGSSHSVAEPAGGTLTFPVTLTDPASSTPRNALNTLTIPYVVQCPLAVLTCGPTFGNATITPGHDTTTISVPVSQSTSAWFSPQSVTVTISAPVGNSDVAVLGTGAQSGTVASTLPAPKVALTPPAGLGSITLPADAGHIYTYTVTLSEPVAVPMHVDFTAQGAPGFASPAINGVDFAIVDPASCRIGTTCVDFNVPLSGVAPLTQSVTIKFLGRGVHGPNRYFQLALSSASLGSIPSGQSITTILTDTYAYGYWLVGTDGGVFPLGAAPYKGSASGSHLAAPVVAITPTPTGQGYWLVSTDGGVYAYGDARFSGSMFGLPHDGVIVGISATPTGKGYWLVGSDGGVYSFGDARFFGSMFGHQLIGSIVGIQATRDGHGYYLVGADGGVFAFGDAVFHGSLPDYCGTCTGSSPILGLAVSPDGGGYWLASGNGGVFAFGDARYHGSGFGTGKHFEAITATSSGDGYWLLASDGTVVAEGKAQNFFDPLKAPGVHLGGPVENMAGD